MLTLSLRHLTELAEKSTTDALTASVNVFGIKQINIFLPFSLTKLLMRVGRHNL